MTANNDPYQVNISHVNVTKVTEQETLKRRKPVLHFNIFFVTELSEQEVSEEAWKSIDFVNAYSPTVIPEKGVSEEAGAYCRLSLMLIMFQHYLLRSEK